MSNSINLNEFVRDSYDNICKNNEHFYELFYENFVNSSAEIKALFEKVSLEKQSKMLHEAIPYLLEFAETKTTNSFLGKLADKHNNELNIKPEMYNLFLDAFAKTLQQLNPKFGYEYEKAWRIALAPGIAFMQHPMW